MALEKIDIRSEVDPVDHAFLKAEADVLDVKLNIHIANILAEHAAKRRRMFIETHRNLQAKGLAGEIWVEPGKSGKFAASDDEGSS